MSQGRAVRSERALRRHGELLALLAGLAVVVGLGLLSGGWLYLRYNGERLRADLPPLISLGDALESGLMDWVLWLPAWPLARALVRRWPVARQGLARTLGVHALAAVLLALLQIGLFALATVGVRSWRFGSPLAGLDAALETAFRAKLVSGTLLAGLVLAGLQAHRAWRAARDQELRSEQLARQLAEARLAALSAALEPHFLFNALGTIQSLVRAQPEVAERMIARLGELLRAVLATDSRPEVSLGEELALLDGYVSIERERFGDRLRLALDVPAETLDASVPTLLLQPLVENAIRHGLSRATGTAELALDARVAAGRLRIRLSDRGPGFRTGADGEGGRGLAAARARLAARHGGAARLSIAALEVGTAVEIELPFLAMGGV